MAQAAKADKAGKSAKAVTSAKADKTAKPAKADKAPKAKPAAKATGKPNAFARLGRYLGDVRSEMSRVVWPSRAEVLNSSGIVLVTLIIFIILISTYDQISVFLLIDVLGKIGG